MPARTKLSSVYSTLPPAERKVADFILSNPDRAAHMVINDIAAAAQVSVPSVTRLARKLGYDGFMEFRVALASGTSTVKPVDESPLNREDSDEVIIKKLMYGEMRAIESTLRVLDCDMFSSLATAIDKCERLVWFGVGNALSPASAISEDLCRMEVDSIVITEDSVMRTYARRLKPGDLFFGISRSGQTQKTIDCIRIAKECGATTAFMTNLDNSDAREYADYFVCTSRLDELYRFCGFETSCSMKALLETLATLVANKRGYIERKDFLDVFTSRTTR